MYVEFLKGLILLGIAAKALAARMWLAAATALAMVYVGVGLLIVVLAHREAPVVSALVGDPPSRNAVVACLLGMMLVSGAVALAGLLRLKRGTPRREVTDLFVLVAILTSFQGALTLQLW